MSGAIIGFRRIRGRIVPIRAKGGEQAKALENGVKAGAAAGVASAGGLAAFGRRLVIQRERTARILKKVRDVRVPSVKPAFDLFDFARFDRASKHASKARHVRRVRIVKLKSILNTQRSVVKSFSRFAPAAVGISALVAGAGAYYSTLHSKPTKKK